MQNVISVVEPTKELRLMECLRMSTPSIQLQTRLVIPCRSRRASTDKSGKKKKSVMRGFYSLAAAHAITCHYNKLSS